MMKTARNATNRLVNGSRKRVTYIHQHFRDPDEGGGTRSWEFARRLVRDGHAVTILCGGQVSETREMAGVRIVKVFSPYLNGMSSAQRIGSFVRFMWRATVIATRTPSDIIFATSTPLTVALPAMIAAIKHRAPFVFEVRDLWPSVPARLGYLRSSRFIWIAQRLEAIAYRRANRIIALSPGMREGVLQTEPTADVVVIPNACDFELFNKSSEERKHARDDLAWNGFRVTYAGSFGDIYRPTWMVELAANCPTIGFTLVGEGSNRGDAIEMAREYGLNPAELLPGMLSKHEVAKRVAAADLGLSSVLDHPALEAASINKVFDSLAAGRPLIFNHDGWLADLVVAEGAGWRLSDSPATAAKELQVISSDPEQVQRAGQKARQLAQRFDREALYQEFKKALCIV